MKTTIMLPDYIKKEWKKSGYYLYVYLNGVALENLNEYKAYPDYIKITRDLSHNDNIRIAVRELYRGKHVLVNECSVMIIKSGSLRIREDLNKKEPEPTNNDGRLTCYWCKKNTEKIQGFTNTYDMCRRCKK